DIQRSMADGGIYGLPLTTGAMVFLYNKDVFDRFGVDYPTDDMSWDDVYDLAKRLTVVDDGVQYKGISLGFAHVVRTNQLSASFFREDNGKANFTHPDFVKAFTNIARFYEIPGLELPNNKYTELSGQFLNEQRV